MIRISDIPKDPKCGICQVCMDKDLNSIEAGREAVRGKKMVCFACSPIVEGTFCLKHGLEMAIKAKKHVDNIVDELSKLVDIQENKK